MERQRFSDSNPRLKCPSSTTHPSHLLSLTTSNHGGSLSWHRCVPPPSSRLASSCASGACSRLLVPAVVSSLLRPHPSPQVLSFSQFCINVQCDSVNFPSFLSHARTPLCPCAGCLWLQLSYSAPVFHSVNSPSHSPVPHVSPSSYVPCTPSTLYQ